MNKSFVVNLALELAKNGKLLTGYALSQGISSFPGFLTSLETAAHDQTPASYLDLGIQTLMLVGAAFRAKKIVQNAAAKS